jgi:hypothetical protein
MSSTTARGTGVSFVVHAHLYQPPREDPWLGSVPREASAAPFHDWNARIHAECYGPLMAARLMDEDGRVRRVINVLERVSFDAAPTLLRWMEREAPETYRAILAADRAAAERLGHGSAIATSYHHVILPLASPRDRRTEIRWGIADFRARFGRDPEGFWLPEAGVDSATLQDLAAEGITFTIVGSGQVDGDPPEDGRAGRVVLDGGAQIAVFAYDGPMAHDVSFGGLLRDADAWADGVRGRADPEREVVVSLATDGETFGHHHTFGELGLARVLETLETDPQVRVENYATALSRLGADHDIEIVSPSAWSCAHGVGRWERACGCRAGGEDTSQAWRTPLRHGLDTLADALHAHFESEMEAVGIGDPWIVRDRFGSVVDAGLEARTRYAAEVSPTADPVRVLELLEMEREILASFTSCAWFFDDLAGLETLNVLRSAARALDLAGPGGSDSERAFRSTLSGAHSNDPSRGDGCALWDDEVRTRPAAPRRAAAVAGFLRALGAKAGDVRAGAFVVQVGDADHVSVTDVRTGRVWSGAVAMAQEGHHLTVASVRADGDDPAVEIGPEDLPDPWDRDVTSIMRSRLLARWLSTGTPTTTRPSATPHASFNGWPNTPMAFRP